ncbi:hypothetical protein QQ045_014326 [Rhodiola kirilowii]
MNDSGSYQEYAFLVKPQAHMALMHNFLKASWEVIGADLMNSIRNFLRLGIMPTGINSRFLALIPKVKNANSPKDFRPISCCNVVYKIISGVIANRLKPVLSYLIDHAQSAFVEGRNMANNVSLVQGAIM